MKTSAFVYNRETITFFDGYQHVNNVSIDDIPQFGEAKICPICVVQLESAYVFRKLCQQANETLLHQYSASIASQVPATAAGPSYYAQQQPNNIIVINYDGSISNGGVSLEAMTAQPQHQQPQAQPPQAQPQHLQPAEKPHDESSSDGHSKKKRKFSLECEICGKAFKNNSYLVQHQRNVHSKYQCSKCAALYTTKGDLDVHRAAEHPATYTVFCDICKKGFANENTRQNHHKLMHQKKCEKCAMHYTALEASGEPEEKEEDNSAKECKFCHKVLLPQSLKQHYQVKHSYFTCRKCPEAFATKEALQIHKNTHTTESFTCSSCGGLFSTRYALKLHIRTMHEQPCNHCNITDVSFRICRLTYMNNT
jgi:Zinc-finger associated domain (zf-AD)/Zinc finger, C2H2 type